jgi:predicted nucleic acid-binding protein
MNYLLDVNILVAWGWKDHRDHERTVRWLAEQKTAATGLLATSAIPEIGFVRVSVQRSTGQIGVVEAAQVLAGMLGSLGERHQFLADDARGLQWPDWCRTASRTTDGHLLELAQNHGLLLATLDEGIPGAHLLP